MITPRLGEVKQSPRELNNKKVCQEGIYRFQRYWQYFKAVKNDKAVRLLDNQTQWGKLVFRFIDMPTFMEARKLGELTHDENVGSSFAGPICTEHNERLVKEMGIENFLSLCKYGYRSSEVYWPQGTLTRVNPGYLFRRAVEANASYGSLSIMSDLVKQVEKDGHRKIVIYGAGEAGQMLLRAAQLHEIDVTCLVDRKQTLWGNQIDSIEIVPLSKAIAGGIHTYVIGSFSFISEIKHSIESAYRESDITPEIYAPPTK